MMGRFIRSARQFGRRAGLCRPSRPSSRCFYTRANFESLESYPNPPCLLPKNIVKRQSPREAGFVCFPRWKSVLRDYSFTLNANSCVAMMSPPEVMHLYCIIASRTGSRNTLGPDRISTLTT